MAYFKMDSCSLGYRKEFLKINLNESKLKILAVSILPHKSKALLELFWLFCLKFI